MKMILQRLLKSMWGKALSCLRPKETDTALCFSGPTTQTKYRKSQYSDQLLINSLQNMTCLDVFFSP